MDNLRFDSPIFTLVQHLFRRFVVETEQSTEEAEHSTIREFVEWANEQYQLFPDKEELEETYDFDEESFELVSKMMERPFLACGQLYSWWPLLVLSSRKPLKHKVKAISLAVAVKFDDDQVVHFPFPLEHEMSDPYTDGMILTLWRNQLNQAIDMVAAEGCDRIYEKCCGRGENVSTLLETKIPKRLLGMGF